MRRVHSALLVVTAAALCSLPGLNALRAQTAPAPATTPSADALIAAGLKKAAAEHKTTFVEFGASWCSPCQKLQAFLDQPNVRPIIDRHFVVVPITVWERGREAAKNNPGGDELLKKWGGRAIPFYAFLGSTGALLHDSHDAGFPERNEEIGAFLDLLSKSASALSASEKTVLADRLTLGTPAMGWNVVAARQIWSEGDFTFRPTMSSDGRYIAVADNGGMLVIHDVIANVDRSFALPASAKDSDDADVYDQPVLSKDGRSLAVSYVDWKTDHRDLRIVPIDAATIPEKPLFSDSAVEWIRPHEWTSDGKWILVELKRGRSGEIGMVSVADGSYKLLKRVDDVNEIANDANYTGSDDTNVMLSPDDKYVVFDLFRKDDPGNRDVFLMRLSDGKESPAVVHPGDDGAFGWTRDGGSLFFVSDRTGEYGLWMTPFRDGMFGPPSLVRPHLGEVTPIGVQPNGSLMYAPVDSNGLDIWALNLDFSTGAMTSSAREYVTDAIGHNNAPAWTPDGKEMLYRSVRDGRNALVAKSVATGAVRIVSDQPPNGISVWAPDGKSFVVLDHGSAQQVDLGTGQRTELAKDVRAVRTWTKDGRLLFERAVPDTGAEPQTVIIERNLASGKEREVFRGRQGGAARLAVSADGRTLYHRRPVPANQPPHDLVSRDLQTGEETVLVSHVPLGGLQLSPDGRSIVSPSNDPATKTSHLLLISTAAGVPPRELRIDDGPLPNLVAFATDSRSMIGMRTVKGTTEYWWIPFDDRRPARLDLPPMDRPIRNVQVSPDGKTVVFEHVTGHQTSGVWLMDFEHRAGR